MQISLSSLKRMVTNSIGEESFSNRVVFLEAYEFAYQHQSYKDRW